jgi:hypothetical protein
MRQGRCFAASSGSHKNATAAYNVAMDWMAKQER